MLLVVYCFYVELRGGHTAPFRLIDSKRRGKIQALQSIFERVPVGSGVDQRADSHVAANARECVKITDFHVVRAFSASSKAVLSLAGDRIANEEVAGAHGIAQRLFRRRG